MDITAQFDQLQVTITDIIDQFKDNCNVNVTCDEIHNALIELAQTVLKAAIEEIICSPKILPVLKAGAGKNLVSDLTIQKGHFVPIG